ncbi:conserved hypothetical protein [Histoplasma capsulatum G186AR]|uniref:Major facilitator superfamily (MFS) profile domain-containing protein n=1 Tax=Ajellomyces capsulatus (strain G186AR / H82 / ATCC MYA-2454 / RMSCC 2432) TaxID=447093 RepID=C0NMI2_AJECG|nr:uncharacterized protein HCBG_03959 [Histoplasma capsulatum G186AR]EEH07080.1 conserved hypothetical protein [Histoplasma capsulatum G186AR]
MSDRLARTLPAGIDGHITAPEALPESDAEQSLKEPQETENRNLEKKDDIANSTQSSSSSAGRCNGKEEFQYHYLTFDTPLPPPTGISVPRPGQPRAPEQPDLQPYISPFTWRKSRKWVVTMLSCLVTTLSAMAAGAYSPPEQILTEKWKISGVVYNLGISVFSFGFALSPMVLAPFSEINGRRPMLVASGILFTCCAVTDSFAGMLLSRLFLGVGGSTFSSIIGGVLSDVYVTEERNTPMALFSGAVLFGTGFGPMVSSFIVHHISWRWVYYLQTIMSAVVTAMVVVFFKETRGNLLLSRKAQALNQWYEQLEEAGYVGVDMPVLGKDGESERQSQRIRWKVKSDEERESIAKVLAISLYRPFPISIGGIIATFLSIWQEKYVHRLGKISSRPEGRLVFVCVESILMPAGMFWFGWTSFPSIHWIVPCLAIGCVTIGIFSIYLAVFNYLADTYHRYASSALAAQSCCRNLLGGVFPLVVRIMYVNLGYPEASSLLGGIGSLLTIVPWVLVFYGPKIRARSKIASEIMTEDERAG